MNILDVKFERGVNISFWSCLHWWTYVSPNFVPSLLFC